MFLFGGNMQFTQWNSWSDVDKQHFRDWLKSVLTTEDVSVIFTKRDGTERVMKATLKEGAIPVTEKKTDRTRAPNDDVISVVDTEIGEWRSIRYDSIKEVRFTLGQSSD